MVKRCNNLNVETVKLLQWVFVEMSKFNDVFFLPKSIPFHPISGRINWVSRIPFIAVLTGSGGVCTCQFLFHMIPSYHLHLRLCLPLPLSHNLIPHWALFSLSIPLPHHICHPHAPISLSTPPSSASSLSYLWTSLSSSNSYTPSWSSLYTSLFLYSFPSSKAPLFIPNSYLLSLIYKHDPNNSMHLALASDRFRIFAVKVWNRKQNNS